MKSKLHPKGKINIHRNEKDFNNSVKNLNEDNKVLKKNRKTILKFINDCRLGKTIKGKRAKKSISIGRCSKYIIILRKISKELNKDFYKVNEKDIEKFITNLEDNKILQENGKIYSEEYKADIKKALKKFYKHILGNGLSYPDMVNWVDTTSTKKDYEALTKEDVFKLVERTSNLRDKTLFLFLFDSGARIEECLNVRLKHLSWKDSIKSYIVRLEFSKTKPRTISIPLCTKYINEWLDQHEFKGNSEAQLFPLSYETCRKSLQRATKKVFNKTYTLHGLRHSSATYYANLLKSEYKLSYRYGWAMGSDMCRRYIDRSGINEEETVEAYQTNEITKIKKENQLMYDDIVMLKESLYKIEEMLKKKG